MKGYYEKLEEAESLRENAANLRACSRHSGVEFDLHEIADRYEDRARELERAGELRLHVQNLRAHNNAHGHYFEFDLEEKAREMEGKI